MTNETKVDGVAWHPGQGGVTLTGGYFAGVIDPGSSPGLSRIDKTANDEKHGDVPVASPRP